jgi:signal transduction histidine kinase
MTKMELCISLLRVQEWFEASLALAFAILIIGIIVSDGKVRHHFFGILSVVFLFVVAAYILSDSDWLTIRADKYCTLEIKKK